MNHMRKYSLLWVSLPLLAALLGTSLSCCCGSECLLSPPPFYPTSLSNYTALCTKYLVCSMPNQALAQHITPPYTTAGVKEVFIFYRASKQSITWFFPCTICQVSQIKFYIRLSIFVQQTKQLAWNMTLIKVLQHLISAHARVLSAKYIGGTGHEIWDNGDLLKEKSYTTTSKE